MKYCWTVLLFWAGLAHAEPVLQDGDLIFHTSRSAQSLAIQQATGSRYSHMGVVVWRNGKPFVFEAVKTVRLTPLTAWIARGEGGHFVAKRLRQPLDAASRAKLLRTAATFAGRPYDLTFEWSDARIYCSELVWKLYDRALGIRIGALQRLREFKLDDPAVRRKLVERYGNKIPLDEPVISPAAMADSDLLVDVVQR
ncbi:MAG: YiiX family permuted papain-like enzyme [Uliginosibacterium sp.]|nr:YiiX family permuted papain-like enzyme [Uliginosibacterium sp.]